LKNGLLKQEAECMIEIIEQSDRLGYGFVPKEMMPRGDLQGASSQEISFSHGVDEYYLRYQQNNKRTYRHLSHKEIEVLERRGNTSSCWDNVLVENPFLPHLIKNTSFAGLIRIGAMQDVLLKYHDFAVPSGITNSVLISCDIGSCTAVHFCSYISHYIIEDNVILSRIDELSATNHAKFGEGIVKDGENEKVRIKIDVINEAGGRDVFPFRSMCTADAFLWAKFRGDRHLISCFEKMTQAEGDARLGLYGVVSKGSVLKSCRIIKDVFVGEYSYIKGANKLKNLSILSSQDESSQIGEGVELVNGIVGYGSHVFYGAKAVRFVIGRHCTLKYGARLIHSILGDNSTISCCEVLNSLIFPFHEQHHNNSFLIAAMIMGQSNMAAGATVGSNHNTRGNDGEIVAGRGFWPGLSTTLKHNCKFASFTLLSKGSYRFELNIPFPFSLVIDNEKEDVLEIMPAYYWMYNMYALERNKRKFETRDKRLDKRLKIESDYLAPDTIGEILKAIPLLHEILHNAPPFSITYKQGLPDIVYTEGEYIERSRRQVKIVKIGRALKAYREMLVWYGVNALIAYFEKNKLDFTSFSKKMFSSLCEDGFSTNTPTREILDAKAKISILEWVNVAGILMPKDKVADLIAQIKNGVLPSWEKVHARYIEIASTLEDEKALHAYFSLCKLAKLVASKDDAKQERCERLEAEQWNTFLEEAIGISRYIKEELFATKQKDYSSFFRGITYDSKEEMEAVLNKIEENPLIKDRDSDAAKQVALFEKYRIGK